MTTGFATCISVFWAAWVLPSSKRSCAAPLTSGKDSFPIRQEKTLFLPVSMSLPGSGGKHRGQLAGLCRVPLLLSHPPCCSPALPTKQALQHPVLLLETVPLLHQGAGEGFVRWRECTEYNAWCTGAMNSLHSFSQAFVPILLAGKTKQTNKLYTKVRNKPYPTHLPYFGYPSFLSLVFFAKELQESCHPKKSI